MSAAGRDPTHQEQGDVELSLVAPRSDQEHPGPTAAGAKRPLAIVGSVCAACLLFAGAACASQDGARSRQGSGAPRVAAKPAGFVWLQASLSDECQASADTGEDCGAPGVTQEQCEEKGCCYDETNGAHWCWKPEGWAEPKEEDKCSTDGELIDCGEGGGFSQESCEAKGCCYDETARFWCFSKEGMIVKLTANNKEGSPGGDAKQEETEEGSAASDSKQQEKEQDTEKGEEEEGEQQHEEQEDKDDATGDASLPSLFCFSVLSRTGDDKLLKVQETTGTSIFGCDEWGKFTSNSTVGRGVASWALTETYIAAWQLLRDDGRWKVHDYVVKVDVDTVFLADELREWLGKNKPPSDDVYISSCKGSLLSSLEVFSTSAVEKYMDKIESCQAELDYSRWGDETFTQKCMDGFDVAAWDFKDLVCDKECSCDPSKCSPGKIGYHPVDDPEAHDHCIQDALR